MSCFPFSFLTSWTPHVRLFNAALTLILLFTGCAVAQRSDLLVWYDNGTTVEQVTRDGVSVMVSLVDTGELNKLKIGVENDSDEAINILPEQIRVHQANPKDEYLEVRSERDLQRGIDHGLIWKELLIGLAAALSRNYTTVQSSTVGVVHTPYGSGLVYGSTVTTISSPDWEMRARWFALGDQIAAEGKTAKEVIAQQSLKKHTVFPGTQLTGTIWFRRHQTLESGVVDVSVGERHYEFPFPPPAHAKAPATGVPFTDSNVTQTESSQPLQERPLTNMNPAASFGIVARTSEDPSEQGVEILDVADDSPAYAAGLHRGYVISSIDGKRVRTINDLFAQLKSHAPNSNVRIGYAFRSNLGWMGNAVVATLPPDPHQ